MNMLRYVEGEVSKMNNHQWVLARTPLEGLPHSDDFNWLSGQMPEIGANQILTRTIYLSLDPYQWGRRRSGTESPGDVCHGRTVSQVVQSNLEGYNEGDFVFNTNGWQEYGLTGEGVSHFGYMFPRKLDSSRSPISTAIGVMGMLGLTAYSGLMIQCQPKAGETIIVSAASGGVGQVACQLAKIAGCRVVGIAGSAQKLDYLRSEVGVDECVSHLGGYFKEELRELCPDGCDVYFENVGGKVYEAVLPLLNEGSRITVCGMISQYGNTDGLDPRQAWDALGETIFSKKNVQVHDLFVGNFVEQYQDEFLSKMADYVSSGRINYKEDRWEGLESAPEAFAALLTGGNFGKTIVSVSEDLSRV